MQQRGSNTTMDSEEGDNNCSTTPPSRSRQNLKLKVLVRSHAMREETSPPREPSPCRSHHTHHHIQSPCIKLIPSSELSSSSSPPPAVVLSPSVATSPTLQCLSPTTTLVPSPNSRCSPNLIASVDNVSPIDRLQSDHHQEGTGFMTSSPKLANNTSAGRNPDLCAKQASHSLKKKYAACDCQNQNCPKCAKNHERNINNNMTNVSNNVTGSPNMLTVSRAGSRGKLKQQSSSQGSFESCTNSPCLSRDSSSEQYTDTTGVDLELFIPETLNRNAKDRALMLRIEQELVNLAKDRSKTHYKFPPMSSYQRMLVHRCAAYFGMDHNIEPTGKCVVVNKTKTTRIPEVEFKEHVKEDIVFSEEPRRSILKRDSNSIEDYSFKSPDRSFSLESRRSKSFEEREEEYEKARRRIFNREMQDGSSEDFGWSEMPWSSTESDCSSRFRLQPPDIHRRQMGKLMKGHSEETGEAARPCVAKSYSFGGYGGNVSVLSRGDSVMSTHSAGPRLLTKQDSGASSVSWRLSPSSSGYKSQSQMSESATPSPTSTPHPLTDAIRQGSNGCGDHHDHHHQEIVDNGDNHIVWAVTDIQNVPRGSVIINPQTGKPLTNEDGSIYHYDPTNLPASICQTFEKAPTSPQMIASKENIPLSPKKTRPIRSSPTTKSHLTNSSTSPIIPLSPPLVSPPVLQSRSFSYMPAENIAGLTHQQQQQHQQQHQLQHQQQFTSYSSTYATPATAETGTVYQQPYLVYTAPYGVHVQQQMEQPSVPEMASTYYIPEPAGPPTAQTITYQPSQPSHYWNHPVAFYQNNPQPPAATPPQRYSSVPMQATAQPGYLPAAYPSNYIPPPAQQAQNPPEMLPVYHNQPVQLVYQNQPAPPSPIVYQNHQPHMIYTHNPVYTSSTTAYPPPQHQQVPSPYPQGAATPNSCAPSTSGQVFAANTVPDSQTFLHLAQSIQQLSLSGNVPGQAFLNHKGPHPQYDFRHRASINNYPKSKQICKNFMMGSSQSSTGTNSPAATVIAGYCPPQNHQQMYRTPPETPPNQFTFPHNFNVPPVMFKQVPNMRASTPGTTRSSRSPTPASDITYYDKQRMSLPPNLYQGLPYVVPATDPRLIPGRGQPNNYRQVAPQMPQTVGVSQGSDYRSRKSRKTKTKSGLPPSGK